MVTDTSATEPETFDAIGIITRNALLGMLIAFALTVGVSLIAGEKLIDSVAIASMPALFAGPFVAGLMTVVQYHHFEERQGAH
jgi:hypothetical protein